MLRVVLDTNAIVSALNFAGKPARVFELAVAEEITNLTSSHILGELKEILRRKFAWERKVAERAANLVRLISELTEPKERLQVVAHEPDNRILECAAAGRAHYIITGDRHLTALAVFKDIRIVDPAAFLDIIEPN